MPQAVSGINLDTTVLDRIANNLGINTDKVIRSIAFQVETKTKQNIVDKDVIDTGNFLGSINTKPVGKNVYWVMDGTEYGIYLELGTSKMAARPTFTPAVFETYRDVHKKFGDLFK